MPAESMASIRLLAEIIIVIIAHFCYSQDVNFDTKMAGRLVSHQFNQEILHQSFVSSNDRPPFVKIGCLPAIDYNILLTRRWLQGHLSRRHFSLRFGPAPFKQQGFEGNIKEAIVQLRKKYRDRSLPYLPDALRRELSMPSLYDPESSSGDFWTVIVCHAVSARYVYDYISRYEVHDPDLKPWTSAVHGYSRTSVAYLTLMIQCMLGDLEGVHESYRVFKRVQKRLPVMFPGDVMSCVSVAAREGHEVIVRYLVKQELDQHYAAPSQIAQEMYENVLPEAAKHRQLQCLPFLLGLVEIGEIPNPDSIAALPILKGVLLRGACKCNNTGFVQFLLDSGDIRVYSSYMWDYHQGVHPFLAATEVGVNAECIRLVLRNQHRFTHTPEQQEAFIEDALPIINKTGRLDLFLEILPYLQQPLLDGALMDGGVEAAVRLRGPFNYSLPIRSVWPGNKEEEFFSSKETTLGGEALLISARSHAIENVEFLLNQQVKTSKKICLPPPGEENTDVYEALRSLLIDAELWALGNTSRTYL